MRASSPTVLVETLKDCVVPENIHTPTTEGIGNSRGVGGGVKGPGNSGEEGGCL